MSEFADDNSETKTSKYNNAVDQIYRLGIIWRNAYKHSSIGDFNSWNLDLDAVWREFAGDIKIDDPREKTFNGINKALLAVWPLVSANLIGFNKVSKEAMDKRSKQYLILMRKEIFLRRLQNELGKGTAWDDTEDDDFG